MIKLLHSDITKSENKRIFEMLLCTNSSVKVKNIFLNTHFLSEGAEVRRSGCAGGRGAQRTGTIPLRLGSGSAACPVAGAARGHPPCRGRGGRWLPAAPASLARPCRGCSPEGHHAGARPWAGLSRRTCGGSAARWFNGGSSDFGGALRVCFYAHTALMLHLHVYPHKQMLESLLENATL